VGLFFHGNNHLFHANGLHEKLFITHGIASRKFHFCAISLLQKYFFLISNQLLGKNVFIFYEALLWVRLINVTFVG